jgi:hypothetical protein
MNKDTESDDKIHHIISNIETSLTDANNAISYDFNSDLKKFLLKAKSGLDIKSIYMTIGTPSFNDGDVCEPSVFEFLIVLEQAYMCEYDDEPCIQKVNIASSSICINYQTNREVFSSAYFQNFRSKLFFLLLQCYGTNNHVLITFIDDHNVEITTSDFYPDE